MSADNVTEIEKLEVFAQDLLARIHTFAPGIVETYNDTLQTATILPGRRGADNDGRPYDLAPVPNVLVLWQTFAGMRAQGVLNKGDEVLFGIPDRSFDKWIAAGGIADQDDAGQAFSLSQALALPVLTSAPKRPGPVGAFYRIGRVDGSAEVRIRLTGKGTALVEVEGAEIKLGEGASLAIARVSDTLTGSAAAAAWALVVETAINGLAPGTFTGLNSWLATVAPPGGLGKIATGATKSKAE